MQIGLIGTGLMGAPMAAHLMAHHHSLFVYNRTPNRTANLAATGATVMPTPASVLTQADVTLLMLTDATAIRATVLNEATRTALAGQTLIQMGTIAPQESQDIAAAVSQAGGIYLEAPVLGSIPEAKNGTLIVMVGAEDRDFQQWLPLFQCLGPEPKLIGPVGSAAALKLALNQLIGALTAAFSVSLGLTQQYGVETEQFMEILRASALYAPTFDKKLPRMESGNFENPNFPTKHLLKDIELCLAAAQAKGLEIASLVGVRDILQQTMTQSADCDYSALFTTITQNRAGTVPH